jgi:hypothetical protein
MISMTRRYRGALMVSMLHHFKHLFAEWMSGRHPEIDRDNRDPPSVDATSGRSTHPLTSENACS